MSDHGPFFRRAVPPDREAFLNFIETERAALAAARAGGDAFAILNAAGTLGSALFMEPGAEGEAAMLLEEALGLSRKRGDRAAEIDGLLGLATARQYLGARDEAVRLFEEGLALCDATGIRAQEHFLLHHLGRCLAEMGRIQEARTAFARALVIREELGLPRFVDSTRAALADVAKMGQ